MKVTVSARMARLQFHGCDPEYIRDVCHGRCCKSPNVPSGLLVHIQPHEVAPLVALGARVDGDSLQPAPGTKGCPFQETTGLCAIHLAGPKPSQCHISPWKLNKNAKLIVAHRYIVLQCHKDGPGMPAYRAFRRGLVEIFGEAETQRITEHLDAGGGDLEAEMSTARADAMLAKARMFLAATRKPQEGA